MTLRIIEPIKTIDMRPAEVRELMEMIERDIGKAFFVPEWARRESNAYHRWRQDAYAATTVMRDQLARLWALFPPGLLVATDGETEAGK